jgi:DNA-binding CsgD family transcriptional regulator/Tfp pilus assembly protein PilF
VNSIALAYQKLNQYDSAFHYYKLALALAQEAGNEFWVGLVSGNMGNLLFLMGRDDEAQPLLEEDYQASIATRHFGSAANAASALAQIELKRGNIDKAEDYVRFSRMHIDTGNLEGKVNYHSNMFAVSKLRQNFKEAALHADSMTSYKTRLAQARDIRILAQADLKLRTERHSAEVKFLEDAKSRQILFRNALLTILFLIAVIGLLWIKRIQDKRKREREISGMREQAAAQKLSHAQKELNTYTRALLEKNELIQSFKEEISLLQEDESKRMDERTVRVQQLLHTSILTEDDWKHFRQLFDEVHPGFFIRLKEKLSDLTPAETRLLALTKLQIPSRDMADMLGISSDSVKKSRHRLRKKINLPEDGSLEELVEMI